MRLSQAHLTSLETCLRKFQQSYLEQIVAPTSPDDQSRREWGTQFHLMMQQYELGVSSSTYSTTSTETSPLHKTFLASVTALAAQLSNVFDRDQSSNRLSEHRRVLEISAEHGQPYLLSAVYDLVFFEAHQATIFDWKTYRRPKHPQWLSTHWQTRLYPFILAETSEYEASQIAMTYWFVRAHDGKAIAPQSITFPYDQAQHDATRQTIQTLLNTLSTHLSAYEQGTQMPKIDEEKGVCGECPFALRCGRSPHTAPSSFIESAALLDIEHMAEVFIGDEQHRVR